MRKVLIIAFLFSLLTAGVFGQQRVDLLRTDTDRPYSQYIIGDDDTAKEFFNCDSLEDISYFTDVYSMGDEDVPVTFIAGYRKNQNTDVFYIICESDEWNWLSSDINTWISGDTLYATTKTPYRASYSIQGFMMKDQKLTEVFSDFVDPNEGIRKRAGDYLEKGDVFHYVQEYYGFQFPFGALNFADLSADGWYVADSMSRILDKDSSYIHTTAAFDFLLMGYDDEEPYENQAIALKMDQTKFLKGLEKHLKIAFDKTNFEDDDEVEELESDLKFFIEMKQKWSVIKLLDQLYINSHQNRTSEAFLKSINEY